MWLNAAHVETLHWVKAQGEILTNWSFMNGKEWNVSYLIHKTSESEWMRKTTYFIPQNTLHFKSYLLKNSKLLT